MPIDIHISVYEGHLNEGFQQKPPIAAVMAQRWYTAPGIQRFIVTENGLKAFLYLPPGITDRGLDIGYYSFGMILSVLIVLISQMFCAFCMWQVTCYRKKQCVMTFITFFSRAWSFSWCAGSLGWRWRSSGVSLFSTSIPRLCHINVGVSWKIGC